MCVNNKHNALSDHYFDLGPNVHYQLINLLHKSFSKLFSCKHIRLIIYDDCIFVCIKYFKFSETPYSNFIQKVIKI